MAGKSAAKEVAITVPPIDIRTFQVRLVGDSPLICHAWADKAKRQMLEKQTKSAAHKKAAKNPEEDYEQSLYPHPEGGYGFPCVAFKAAAVGACRYVEGMRMTEARGAFHIVGELAQLEGQPEPREDMVRIGMGTADIRYRGQFPKWATTLTIRYNERAISPEQIVNLLNVAGFGVGVGEWRPERDGSFGLFHCE